MPNVNINKLVHLVLCLKNCGLPLPAIVNIATSLGICWKRHGGKLIYYPGKVRTLIYDSVLLTGRIIPLTIQHYMPEHVVTLTVPNVVRFYQANAYRSRAEYIYSIYRCISRVAGQPIGQNPI